MLLFLHQFYFISPQKNGMKCVTYRLSVGWGCSRLLHSDRLSALNARLCCNYLCRCCRRGRLTLARLFMNLFARDNINQKIELKIYIYKYQLFLKHNLGKILKILILKIPIWKYQFGKANLENTNLEKPIWKRQSGNANLESTNLENTNLEKPIWKIRIWKIPIWKSQFEKYEFGKYEFRKANLESTNLKIPICTLGKSPISNWF